MNADARKHQEIDRASRVIWEPKVGAPVDGMICYLCRKIIGNGRGCTKGGCPCGEDF